MMTPSALRLPDGKYPSFLPNNFYEAPQYASFRPLSTPAHRTRSLEFSGHAYSGKPIAKPPRQRRTVRTVSTLFDPDRRVRSAKLDLITGEVTPHDYKDYFYRGPTAKRKSNVADTEPFWMRMPIATRSIVPDEQVDTSRKKLCNGVKLYLQHLLRNDDAECSFVAVPAKLLVQSQFPCLGHLIDSVNSLSTGGTRGLVTTELLAMLTHLDFITPAAVRRFKGCSVRHSERIAAHLRVIVRAFMAQEEGDACTEHR